MPKIINAIVISNKMTNTIVVSIDRVVKHPKYLKILKRKTKLFVHNDLGDIPVGSKVSIQETKPYSKNTTFKVIEIIKGTRHAELVSASKKKSKNKIPKPFGLAQGGQVRDDKKKI